MNDQKQEGPAFYICHHDASRTHITPQVLGLAAEKNYDSLSIPITTDAFHTRVTTLLSSYLYNSNIPEDQNGPIPVVPSLGPTDTNLVPAHVVPQLLGLVSPWIDLCSPDPVIYQISKQVLDIEVAYASFCGVTALVLPAPKLHHGPKHGGGVGQYAFAIKEAMQIAAFIQFSVTLPMMDNPAETSELETSLAHLARPRFLDSSNDDRRPSNEVNRRHDFFGTWDAWNVIRSVCSYSGRLFVNLVIPRYLPHSGICSRWQSEPLRVLQIDGSSFFTNPSGFPVMTANHRALLSQYMRLRNPPCILLTGVGPIPGEFSNGGPDDDQRRAASNHRIHPSQSTMDMPTPSEAHGQEQRRQDSKTSRVVDPSAHLGYLRWFQANQPARSRIEYSGAGYEDYLQAPLQPLAHNLESLTYEVFEQDPVKYDLYELAIWTALKEWHTKGKSISGQNGKVVVAVVGAGRGPLVSRALKASRESGIAIELWALEKNPNAFVLLRRQNSELWNNEVKLVRSDMRSWRGPSMLSSTSPQRPMNYHIDIVISELLGSFADNELSPECLDGIMPLLNPAHGLSIPQSYSAWLTPIAAPKLHSELLPRSAHDSTAFNTPYVVMLQSHDYLATKSHTSAYGPDVVAVPSSDAGSRPSAEFQSGNTTDDDTHLARPPMPTVREAWSFHHGPAPPISPNLNNSHNDRHTRLTFDLRHRGICHGLAGYFEAVLYPGIELSTNPLNMQQKSADMMSWFPIFFPLKTPLYAPDHSSLVIEMWRATDNRKVWYEWMVEAWTNNPNTPGGAGFRLGCSELMSSKEQACLM